MVRDKNMYIFEKLDRLCLASKFTDNRLKKFYPWQ